MHGEQEVWDPVGAAVEECVAAVEQSETQRMFRQTLFLKVVPNVKRRGLLTPFVCNVFKYLGSFHFENGEAPAESPCRKLSLPPLP